MVYPEYHFWFSQLQKLIYDLVFTLEKLYRNTGCGYFGSVAFTPYTADVGVRRTEYQHLSSCTKGVSHTAKVLFQGLWQVRNSHLQLAHRCKYKTKEISVLFNDPLNTFYLRLYGVRHMVKDHSDSKRTCCRHMGYSFRLTARVLLYAPSHRQDSTYHSLCYTSRGALAGTRNSSMGPSHEGSIRRPIAP